MLKLASRAALAALVCTVSSHALAQSSAWRISESTGAVTVRRGDGQAVAKSGMTVQPGDAIVTGAGGRAVIVHDRDFVTVAGNSRVRVPVDASSSGITRLFQELGNALFRIEKRGKPHFAVDTPYLAAVVKGTTFSITVGAENTSLQVTEGVVEVATTDGGARDLVRPGSIAMIAAKARYRLSISGDQNRVIESPGHAAAAGNAAPTAPASVPSDPGEAITEPTPAADDVGGTQANGSVDEKIEPELLNATTPVDTPPNSIETETIGMVISSKPVDLGKVTGGLVTGGLGTAAAPIALASASAVREARYTGVIPTPGGSTNKASGDHGNEPDAGANSIEDAAGRGADSQASPPVNTGSGGGTSTGNGSEPGKDGSDNGSAKGASTDDQTPSVEQPGKNGGEGTGAENPETVGDKGPAAEKPSTDDGKGPGAEKPDKGDGKGSGVEEPSKDEGEGSGADKPGKAEDKGSGAEESSKDDGKGSGADKPGKDDDKASGVGKPNNGDDKGSGADKPGKDDGKGSDAEKPGKDDSKGSGADKPGKDDGKGSGADKPGKDDGNGSGADKPDKGDGKGSDAEKPGKDDGKGSGADKPGKDDGKGSGADKPGKDDGNGSGADKPGKDDGKESSGKGKD